MSSRFDYVEYNECAVIKQEKFKELVILLEKMIEKELYDSNGDGREKSLAIIKLEECYMWIGKSIKIRQENHDKELKKEMRILGLDPQD